MLYLVQTALIWSVLYWLYALLFKGETFFRANRAYLLSALWIGLLLPLVPPIGLIVGKASMDGAVLFTPVAAVNAIIKNTAETTPPAAWFNWQYFFWILYGIGLGVNGYRFIAGCIQLRRLMQQYGGKKTEEGFQLVEVPGISQSFSFFNVLFRGSSSTSTAAERELIHAHEAAHIRQYHSFDVLFLEILTLFFWFNPLIYKFKNALRTVHEYLADEAALRHTSIQQYGHLLIGQAQSGPVLALANHFSHAQLKQRILMMTQSKSRPARRWKYTLALPITLLMLSLFSVAQAIAQKTADYYIDTTKPDQLLTNIDTIVTFDPKTYEETVRIVNSNIHTRVDQLPRYVAPGSRCEDLALRERDKCAQSAFAADLQQYMVVPEEVKSGKVKGRVIIKAVIGASGSIWLRPVPFKSLSRDCDAAAYRALLMLKGNWVAGKLKDVPAETEILIPVDF